MRKKKEELARRRGEEPTGEEERNIRTISRGSRAKLVASDPFRSIRLKPGQENAAEKFVSAYGRRGRFSSGRSRNWAGRLVIEYSRSIFSFLCRRREGQGTGRTGSGERIDEKRRGRGKAGGAEDATGCRRRPSARKIFSALL